MKKIKLDGNKLTLARETLRTLSDGETNKVQGGMFTTKPSVYNCPPTANYGGYGGYGGGWGGGWGGGYSGGGYSGGWGGGGGYGGGGYW